MTTPNPLLVPDGWIVLTPSDKAKPAQLVIRISTILAFDHHAGHRSTRVWVAGTDFYHVVDESLEDIVAKISDGRR